ncbi:MAG: glucuronate isomerase, partial [Elusimicrobiota bacterium]|nr:glucuronate isomerase [Elusimicrobiota bacterium]
MKTFLDKDFLLSTDTAKKLYHDFAEKKPVLDYHCHIIPKEIAENKRFENITQIWLGGDHYKWRLMRANGIEE